MAWQHGDDAGFEHLVAVRQATMEGAIVFTGCDDGATLCRDIVRAVLGVDVGWQHG